MAENSKILGSDPFTRSYSVKGLTIHQGWCETTGKGGGGMPYGFELAMPQFGRKNLFYKLYKFLLTLSALKPSVQFELFY